MTGGSRAVLFLLQDPKNPEVGRSGSGRIPGVPPGCPFSTVPCTQHNGISETMFDIDNDLILFTGHPGNIIPKQQAHHCTNIHILSSFCERFLQTYKNYGPSPLEFTLSLLLALSTYLCHSVEVRKHFSCSFQL